jgi:putative membrane protein
MIMLAMSLVILVAVIHIAIAVTEMFLWHLPQVHTRLGYDMDGAKKVAPIVANAGLYNGFLAAGLIWGLSSWGSSQTLLFFLTCVIVAGIFGAMTLKW